MRVRAHTAIDIAGWGARAHERELGDVGSCVATAIHAYKKTHL